MQIPHFKQTILAHIQVCEGFSIARISREQGMFKLLYLQIRSGEVNHVDLVTTNTQLHQTIEV